jgi:hypothetical protein
MRTESAPVHPAADFFVLAPGRLPGFFRWRAKLTTETPNVAAFTVDEFLVRNRISRGLFYKLVKGGTGPRIMKAGGRTLVSAEAERDWHRSLEAKSAGAAA